MVERTRVVIDRLMKIELPKFRSRWKMADVSARYLESIVRNVATVSGGQMMPTEKPCSALAVATS